ncbi:MAG: hypothetical protein R3350_09630 [Saprospiraceae bacterium]|nr:hypothetical protein [Saprospiraceae bacterium]
MLYRTLLIMLVLFLLSPDISAQKVMQIERYGRAKTKKYYPGDRITYQLKNSGQWYTGTIEELLVDDGLIAFSDRYVAADSIAAFRFDKRWAKSLGKQMMYFGAGWSVFAAIGTATDGNDDTRYRLSDAVVSASAVTTGFFLPRLFRYKTIRFGKRRRIRLLDLNPLGLR